MKITRKDLIRIIKEELSEAMPYPQDRLNISSKEDGSGWKLTGSFKGRKVDVDSSDSGEKLLTTPPDQIRFALARTLLGYFYNKEGEGGLKVNEPMLQGTLITKDGTPIK